MKEFELIEKLLRPLAGKNSAGLADDCAHFGGYVITKDMLLSGVHFFADDDAYDLARKALRVNLSDLASCGAEPFGFLLGLALPKNTGDEWLKKFTAGLKADIEEFKFQLLGGDTTMHEGELAISVTAIGKAANPITRSGAKAGDNIFVSGNIGDGYIGLKKRAGKYLLPEPRIELGKNLHGVATACIDISDGLLADLGHICEASRLGAELDSRAIPISSKEYPLMELITSGDDYELCFTSTANEVKGCYKIGHMVAGSGIKLDGKQVEPRGYQHGA